jgi:gamma-glutamylcyclotransferase (GGCT)/AIG2-like uncharacterized protein YtfP
VEFDLFVNGTLMQDLELHANLDGSEFLGEVVTAPVYRLYSIDDRHPGMFEVTEGGVSVKGELYRVSEEVWARIEAGEPPNLYRGTVELAGGRKVYGVLYPRELAEGQDRDISEYRDWRLYTKALNKSD